MTPQDQLRFLARDEAGAGTVPYRAGDVLRRAADRIDELEALVREWSTRCAAARSRANELQFNISRALTGDGLRQALACSHPRHFIIDARCMTCGAEAAPAAGTDCPACSGQGWHSPEVVNNVTLDTMMTCQACKGSGKVAPP